MDKHWHLVRIKDSIDSYHYLIAWWFFNYVCFSSKLTLGSQILRQYSVLSYSSSYLILLANTKEATHASRDVNLPNCDFYTSFSKKQGRKTRFLNQCIAAASWQSTGHKSAHLQWTGKENKAKNWSRPNWVQWCRKVKISGGAGSKGWAESAPPYLE